MAGKYNLFLVLWLVVACLASGEAGTSSTSEPTTELEGAVNPTAGTEKTPTTGGVNPTAGTAATPTTGAVNPTAGTAATPTTGGVNPTAGTAATPTTGAVNPTAGTAATPTTGGVNPTAGTAATPTTGGVNPTAGTAATPTTGGVNPTAGTAATPTTGGVNPTAGTAATPTTGGVNPTAGTAATPTPATPDPCQPNPCGQGSTCAVRANQAFVCLCLPGDSYNYGSKACVKAKVFPGQLSLPNLNYTDNMENKQSPEFKEAAESITTELSKQFSPGDKGFSNATVLSLQKLQQSRVGSVRNVGVNASIEIIFSASSTIKTSDVTSGMETAAKCDDCPLAGATFEETDMCVDKPCDEESTTNCTTVDGTFRCSCKDTYIKTNFSSRICLACPSGMYAVDSSFCKHCDFGYSGLDCSEHWKLALVIVGSILGGLLLITLILLPILALRSSKKSTKKSKHEDIGKPYVSHFPAKAPMANGNGSYANSQIPSYHGSGYEGAGVPKIPRATANNNWDRRTNLEMTPSNSRQNLVPMGSNSRNYDDDEDHYAPARPQNNHYAPAPARPQSSLYAPAPARPQSNPYAQSRPQSNPYAANQGQNNPYYQ